MLTMGFAVRHNATVATSLLSVPTKLSMGFATLPVAVIKWNSAAAVASLMSTRSTPPSFSLQTAAVTQLHLQLRPAAPSLYRPPPRRPLYRRRPRTQPQRVLYLAQARISRPSLPTATPLSSSASQIVLALISQAKHHLCLH